MFHGMMVLRIGGYRASHGQPAANIDVLRKHLRAHQIVNVSYEYEEGIACALKVESCLRRRCK